MADFSKQYCERYNPEMPWDFDIDEEFDNIEPGYYVSLICEGFGFCCIYKDDLGNKKCGFRDFKNDEIVFVDYDSITDRTYREIEL